MKLLRTVGAALLALAMLLGLVYLALPNGPRDPMAFDDPWNQDRPPARGTEYMVVTGTPWASQAAADILDQGGNAFDAAAAALLMLNVTHGEAASFPGIAPLMIYDAKTGSVRSYIGAGTAPQAATIERFKQKGYQVVPELDIWAQLLPASPDVIIAMLRDYGTLSFAQVSAPAIQTAREGFPVHKIMHRNMDLSFVERLGFAFLLPYNTQVYLGGQWWRPLYYKDRFKQPDLANSLQAMADAETRAASDGKSRAESLQAARDYFYTGPLADAIIDLHQQKGGLFTRADLANYTGGWETPAQGRYGEYTFLTNGAWSQGAAGVEALQILDGIDLKSMGHNTPRYVHTVTQAIELAMADREAYLADPRFVQVPMDTLTSPAFAAARRAAMTEHAFGPLPAPGPIPGAALPAASVLYAAGQPVSTGHLLAQARFGKDTTHLAIIDRWGNAVSLTPSDFPKTPMVPGAGLTLGNRMTQFRLDPAHPNRLEPGKRPRVTPHAVIVLKDGRFYMAFGTPGDDMQTQAWIQTFLNMQVFGMDIQQAINAPRFRTMSMPASFAPHESAPGTLLLEGGLYDRSAEGLRALGYTTERSPDWDNTFGAVGAAIRTEDGLLGGSDPREETWAVGK